MRAQFEATADAFARVVAEEPSQVSDEVQLNFYGLYKQAVSGDAPTAAPWALALRARKKWEAWSALRGLAPEQAMKQYVELETMLR